MEQQRPLQTMAETFETEIDRLKAAALSSLPFDVAKDLTPLDLCNFQLQLSSMRVMRSAEHPMVVLNQVHLWANLVGHVLQGMERAVMEQAERARAEAEQQAQQPPPEEKPQEPILEPKKTFFQRLAANVTT